jgi:integrase/recombinase XerD
MKITQIIDDYVSHKRSLGMRFDSQANVLKTFHRAIGPVDAEQIDQETVRAFLNRSQRISSSWHMKYGTLDRLFRYAIQRGLLATSPMPYLIPKRPAYAKPYIYSPEELRRACWTRQPRSMCIIPRTGNVQAFQPIHSARCCTAPAYGCPRRCH